MVLLPKPYRHALDGAPLMQQTLFGSCENTCGKARTRSISKRRQQIDEGEPLLTLFGLVETKAQARRRAKRIVQLLGAIEDAPEAIRSCKNHIDTLRYFIERSLQVKLDPNDRDGLQRLVGDTEEVLTEADCEEMRSNLEIWRAIPCRMDRRSHRRNICCGVTSEGNCLPPPNAGKHSRGSSCDCGRSRRRAG